MYRRQPQGRQWPCVLHEFQRDRWLDMTTASERSTAMQKRTLEVRELFEVLSHPDITKERHAQVRESLVHLNIGLVEHLARRFRGRGEPFEDLVQVGTIGLLKAIDRFDPARGVDFSSFAAPTVLGEIKRYFRDKGWAIRVPRHLQELRLSLATATQDLTHELHRSPKVSELAERLGITEDDVIQGLESTQAYSTQTLDPLIDPESEAPSLVHVLGTEDPEIEGVENRESLKPLVQALPEREKRLLEMRFYQGMTQSQIATELGISQMHVSRLLSRTLGQLRESLIEPQ
jgi:RNA polymerase sigma-B factor